jgi:hypothetical protein
LFSIVLSKISGTKKMQSSGFRRKNCQEQLGWEMILLLAKRMKAEVIAAWAAEGRAHLHAP